MKRLTLILPRLPWLVVLRKWHLGKAPMLPKPGMAVQVAYPLNVGKL